MIRSVTIGYSVITHRYLMEHVDFPQCLFCLAVLAVNHKLTNCVFLKDVCRFYSYQTQFKECGGDDAAILNWILSFLCCLDRC